MVTENTAEGLLIYNEVIRDGGLEEMLYALCFGKDTTWSGKKNGRNCSAMEGASWMSKNKISEFMNISRMEMD